MNIRDWFKNFNKKPEEDKPKEEIPFEAYLANVEIELMEKLTFVNGQLRGGINAKAREENLDILAIFMETVYKRGLTDGYNYKSLDINN